MTIASYSTETSSLSLFKFPLLPAHGALLVDLLRLQPLHDAVDVEAMRTLTPHQRAIVTREPTVRAATVKGHPANSAAIVIGNPSPSCYPSPRFDFNLHILRVEKENKIITGMYFSKSYSHIHFREVQYA